jgi:hypothetical protein
MREKFERQDGYKFQRTEYGRQMVQSTEYRAAVSSQPAAIILQPGYLLTSGCQLSAASWLLTPDSMPHALCPMPNLTSHILNSQSAIRNPQSKSAQCLVCFSGGIFPAIFTMTTRESVPLCSTSLFISTHNNNSTLGAINKKGGQNDL